MRHLFKTAPRIFIIPFHTAHHYYQLNILVRSKDYWIGFVCLAGSWEHNPKGAGLQVPFQFLSGRPFVHMFSHWLVLSYSVNIPQTPKIFTDSEPPIKWLLGELIRGAPDRDREGVGWPCRGLGFFCFILFIINQFDILNCSLGASPTLLWFVL